MENKKLPIVPVVDQVHFHIRPCNGKKTKTKQTKRNYISDCSGLGLLKLLTVE